MLGVRQWCHGAFCVSRQHRLCRRWPRRIRMYYSWKGVVLIHCLWNNVYHRWITNNFPSKWNITASTASSRKSSPRKIFRWNSSGDYSAASGSKKTTAKQRDHRLAQRGQLRQRSDDKCVQRQRQNTTITLQTKPMKRGNTGCRRCQKRRDWIRQRLKFTVKVTFFDAAIGSKNCAIITQCRRVKWDEHRTCETLATLP